MPTTTLSTTETVPFPTEVFGPTGVKLLQAKSSEELPLAVNFRDLADADRSKIEQRKVYRSSEIFKLEVLSKHGIKSLLDMRKQEGEKETHPVYCALESGSLNGFLESSKLKIYRFNFIKTSVGLTIVSKMPKKVWWDLFKGKMTGLKASQIICPAVANPKTMGFSQFYKILIDKSTEAIAESLKIFADERNYPIMMHCTHGKDRTGIISFLLEAICDVSIQDITADYRVSEVNLKNAKAKYKLPLQEMLLKDPVITADKGNMTELLDHIKRNYGGLIEYLQYIGVTQKEVENIRMNLMKS